MSLLSFFLLKGFDEALLVGGVMFLILNHESTYTTFCHSPDTFKKRVSKNTFFVLVRVVDELW